MGYHGSPGDSIRSEIDRAKDRADRRIAARSGRMPIRRRWRMTAEEKAAYEAAKAFNIKHGLKPWKGIGLPTTYGKNPRKVKVTLPVITMPFADE